MDLMEVMISSVGVCPINVVVSSGEGRGEDSSGVDCSVKILLCRFVVDIMEVRISSVGGCPVSVSGALGVVNVENSSCVDCSNILLVEKGVVISFVDVSRFV